MGDPTSEAGRALLTERSPLNFADRIQRPLLIGQGANDPRVNVRESDQIVAAMKAKDIPVTYVVFPDEGHGFARPVNNIAFFAVSENFLGKCLGGRAEAIGGTVKASTAQVKNGIDRGVGVSTRRVWLEVGFIDQPSLPEAIEDLVPIENRFSIQKVDRARCAVPRALDGDIGGHRAPRATSLHRAHAASTLWEVLRRLCTGDRNRMRDLKKYQPTVRNHGSSQNSVVAAAKRFAERFESQSGDGIEGNPASILRLPAG